MSNTALQKVIERLEAMPKQGESYDHKGRHGWANPIRQDTGGLLEALVIASKPARILEIGTAHGLSACYLAKYFVSWGTFITIEWDEKRAEEAKANFAEAGLKIQVKQGDALKIIPTLTQEFDFVFLDANKDGYLEQLNALNAGGKLATGCLIVADNVIDRATECADFLKFMANKKSVILQTECGLLVGRV